MRQLRDRLTGGARTVGPAASAARPSPSLPAPTTPVHIEDLTAAACPVNSLDTARDIYQQHARVRSKLTGKVLGELLGVSDCSARRLLRQANTDNAPT